jgi:hypothetical protein
MKQPFVVHVFCVLAISSLPGACATTPAPGISGRWTPVNHYAATPREIPLYQAYVFQPSPMDRTLKTMLARWAKDSKMTLAYAHPSDFTLYEPVAQIRTGDLHEAVARLSALYAAQHVLVTVDGDAIVVRQSNGVASMQPTPVSALQAPDGTVRP